MAEDKTVSSVRNECKFPIMRLRIDRRAYVLVQSYLGISHLCLRSVYCVMSCSTLTAMLVLELYMQ